MRELLGLGVEVEGVKETCGETALVRAVFCGRADAVRVLVEEGADVNRVGIERQTPLYLACSFGYTDTVRVLLEAGADVGFVDKDGKTALDVAPRWMFDDYVRLFEEARREGEDAGVDQE